MKYNFLQSVDTRNNALPGKSKVFWEINTECSWKLITIATVRVVCKGHCAWPNGDYFLLHGGVKSWEQEKKIIKNTSQQFTLSIILICRYFHHKWTALLCVILIDKNLHHLNNNDIYSIFPLQQVWVVWVWMGGGPGAY